MLPFWFDSHWADSYVMIIGMVMCFISEILIGGYLIKVISEKRIDYNRVVKLGLMLLTILFCIFVIPYQHTDFSISGFVKPHENIYWWVYLIPIFMWFIGCSLIIKFFSYWYKQVTRTDINSFICHHCNKIIALRKLKILKTSSDERSHGNKLCPACFRFLTKTPDDVWKHRFDGFNTSIKAKSNIKTGMDWIIP